MMEQSLENKTFIYIVDDSKMDILIINHYLEKFKFESEIIPFTNGKNALIKIHDLFDKKDYKKIPYLIFLDINIVDMTGFEFLDHLNKISKEIAKEVKIVFVSSSDDLHDLKKAKAYSNVLNYIIKPINMPESFWNNLKRIKPVL